MLQFSPQMKRLTAVSPENMVMIDMLAFHYYKKYREKLLMKEGFFLAYGFRDS